MKSRGIYEGHSYGVARQNNPVNRQTVPLPTLLSPFRHTLPVRGRGPARFADVSPFWYEALIVRRPGYRRCPSDRLGIRWLCEPTCTPTMGYTPPGRLIK